MATEAGGFDALLSAFDRFYKTLDAATVPTEGGGRRVDGVAHAVALSEATNALYGELAATDRRLIQQHGQPIGEYPAGLVLMESDSPGGPWTPVPADEIRMATMGIGGNGADAALMAALESARKVAGFPIDKWNAMQAARPGANHQRFHAGDVVSANDLAKLESAAKLLRLKAPPAPSTAAPILPAGSGARASNGDDAGPALTPNRARVLQAMALFDPSRLVSSRMIAEEMAAPVRLSEETVRQCVGWLIESELAERPVGERSGARLNTRGRKLAGQIAD